MQGVLAHAAHGDLLLLNGTVPGCLVDGAALGIADDALGRVDLLVRGGRIAALAPAGSGLSATDLPVHDLDGGMILPTLVDVHTHLDKGHILPRRPNPDGTFGGALGAVGADRIASWTAGDVRARMDFALRCAHAHGTSHIRTHIDSLPPQDEISWPVFEEVRADWADRIVLQGSCLFGVDRLVEDPGFVDSIADRVAAAGGVLGAVTYMVPGLDGLLDLIVRAAMERGLDLDFHVDETKDPEARSFEAIARAVLRNGFSGKVTCGHCCSLARQGADEADRTMDLVAQAGIGVVSLPMCNMYLQDREAGRTPRWRGVTLLHELKARGVPVAVASDNTRDPFYAYGDLDVLEVYIQATRILQLDHPVGDWITSVTTQPASMMGLNAGRLTVGGPADLLLFSLRNWGELLARPRAARTVLRKGHSISQTLPDYRELDPLMTGSGAAA